MSLDTLGIMTEVNTFVKASLPTITTISKTVFPGASSEEIMARVLPSDYTETPYMDGSRTGMLNIAYYAKSLNQVTAQHNLDLIIDLLDISTSITLTNALTVLCKSVSRPVLVSYDDKKIYVFTCSVALEYFVAAA